MNSKKILVCIAHPTPGETWCRKLASEYIDGAIAAGAEVKIIDLSDLKFERDLDTRNNLKKIPQEDLLHAQKLFEWSEHIAWFFPTWWANIPSLLSSFIERIFLTGWAYKYEKGQVLPIGLLKGRSSRVITTMDSPNYWYFLWQRSAIHGSFINGTLRFVGLSKIRTSFIYSQRDLSDKKREKWHQNLHTQGSRDAKNH